MIPPFACVNPRAIASPSPAPRLSGGVAVLEGLEDPRRARRPSDPGRDRAHEWSARRPRAPPCSSTALSAGENFSALSRRLASDACHLRCVDPHRLQAGRRFDGDAICPLADLGERAADEIVDASRAPSSGAAAPASSLERSRRSSTSRLRRRVSAAIVSRARASSASLSMSDRVRQCLGSRSDGSERGAEIVADAAQDRRLGGVAPAERLRPRALAAPAARGRPPRRAATRGPEARGPAAPSST